MQIMRWSIRIAFVAMFVLSAAAPGGATAATGAAPATPAATLAGGAGLAAFQLVAPGVGWALAPDASAGAGQSLFWTDSNGARWTDITPPGLAAADNQAAAFADADHGWVVSTAPTQTGELSYALARTADGGRTWQSQAMALFAPGEAAGMAGAVYLQFIDAQTGWLAVKQMTSQSFSLGTLFKTSDGGDHWMRLSLPAGGPVHFTNALDGQLDALGWGRYATHDGGSTWQPQTGPSAPQPAGEKGLSGLSMATASQGWARSQMGTCVAGTCTLVTQLLATHDGGQTWSAVSLPGGQTSLQQSMSTPGRPSAPQDSGGLWVTYQGQGFDFCDPAHGLPSLADMETWYLNSPYGVWGLYLGGASNHGLCGTLTQSYVTQLAQEGWRFIPTWVGPQAPCTGFLHTMAWDTGTANAQGVAEADQAISVAQSLGLALPDGSGTIIQYDVEYYTGNQACLNAVSAFISGWSGELRAHGDQAGVYGAPCGQSLSAFVNVPNVPDVVWSAIWNRSQYDPQASVFMFGRTYCGFSDSLWTNHQRMRQYAGGHDENWGGVTFNIDSDVIDAKVAQVPVNCVPGFGQVGLFVDWYFGAQCVLKQAGQYPTQASIGLPPGTISSLRVGPYTSVTVCRGEFYGPLCQTFTSDVADLGGQPIGNDTVSSARVSITIAMPNQLYVPIIMFGGP